MAFAGEAAVDGVGGRSLRSMLATDLSQATNYRLSAFDRGPRSICHHPRIGGKAAPAGNRIATGTHRLSHPGPVRVSSYRPVWPADGRRAR